MSTSGGSAINFNRSAPVIDYTSIDYAAVRADLITYAQATYADRWTDFNPTQFAVVFLELLSYAVDLMSFYMNAGLREMAIVTAQRRSHILTIAQAYDYALKAAAAASSSLSVTSNPAALPYAMPAATTKFSAGSVIFQPDQDYTITVTPQTITVVEGEQFTTVVIGTSAGTEGQQFVIPNAPIVGGSLIVYVAAVPWTLVTTFTLSGASDTVYRTTVDDEGNVTVIFGDGVNGKIPPAAATLTASYKVGGGAQGNVGVGTISSIVSAPAGVLSVTNAASASGGADEETIEQARAGVPASIASGDRCVNVPDYATKALASSTSVAKAMALQFDSRTVRVVIAPSGGGTASDALKNTVLSYLASRKMIGHRVRAGDPFYPDVALNIDLFVTKAAKVGDMAVAAKALLLTSNANDTQNGLLDFANVGFGARDDQGNPQLTVSLLDAALAKLGPRGLQTSRINKMTTIPKLKANGFVNSGNAALAFTQNATQTDEVVRRRFRVQFTSGTTYNVYEGINGQSTQLTRGVLTDDRALFPSLTSAPSLSLNPNTNQSTTLAVNAASSTGQTIVLANATDDLYAYAQPGDTYRVEWQSNPTTGTVGVAYTPTKLDSNPHGWSWTITGSGFVSGDQYWVDVFAYVDDLLLDIDEIPSLSASNLTINIRTAY